MYDWGKWGDGGHGWREMEGTGRTNPAPGAGGVRDHVFVAIKGLDGHVYINQADLGRPFNNQWSQSDLVTDVAPAVPGVGNSVSFFVKSLDRIWYAWALSGEGGHGSQEVRGQGPPNDPPPPARGQVPRTVP